MPYRGLEQSGPSCYRHAAAPATESCSACLQPICEICLGFEDTRPHCPLCAKKVQRRRTLQRRLSGALTLMFFAAIVGGIGFFVTRKKPFDYGTYSGEVRINHALLEREPCDRTGMLRLSQAMLRAGDDRGTLQRIAAFHDRCGEWPRLLWVSYSAHMRLGERDAAIADASRLIAVTPTDKDFWWWRAQAYEDKGLLDKAAADYRKALEIEPALTGIPFNLANLLERQGHLCEARAPILQFLEHHPDVKNRERIQAQLDRLQRDGHCQ
jgi:hypothetical protein